jgi:hypothetical protein
VFSVVRTAAVSGQNLRKHVPGATDTNATTEEQCFLCEPCRKVTIRTDGAISSVGLCTGGSSALEVVKTEPERVKFEKFHSSKPLPGNGCRRHRWL